MTETTIGIESMWYKIRLNEVWSEFFVFVYYYY
jgi:hypothetical protein